MTIPETSMSPAFRKYLQREYALDHCREDELTAEEVAWCAEEVRQFGVCFCRTEEHALQVREAGGEMWTIACEATWWTVRRLET
jgi:hypothetical protein